MMSDDGKLVMHCELTVNGGRLMLGDAFPDYGYPWEEPKGVTLTLPVSEPHDLWKRAVETGCEVTMPLEVAFWGDWYGQVKDPFGHVWAFVAPAEKKQE
jgi:PhnB protein